jgi:hypothetical protein
MGTVVSKPEAPIAVVGSIVRCHANRYWHLPYSPQRVLANEVAEKHGFRMVWVFVPPSGPITDFNAKNTLQFPYPLPSIGTDCQCKNVNGKSKVMKCRMGGGTWLDMWKALEEHYEKKQCHHYVIQTVFREYPSGNLKASVYTG